MLHTGSENEKNQGITCKISIALSGIKAEASLDPGKR